MSPQLLGERLCQKKLITDTQLETALILHKQQGVSLGRVLTHEGFLDSRSLHQTLAEQAQRPYLDLVTALPDPKLLRPELIDDYIRLHCLPWRRIDGTMIIATSNPTPELELWMRKRFGITTAWVITSPRDLISAMEKYLGPALEENCRTKLWREQPNRSARIVVPPTQRTGLQLLLLTMLALCIWQPDIMLVTIVITANLFYFTTLFFKLELLCIGLVLERRRKRAQYSMPMIPDHKLPVITVLVPLYQEAVSVPRLINSLRAIDYPRARLDIKLVVEADDIETIEAIKKAKPESCFEIIRVPYSQPRTKPKACNYALSFAKGELVTIYDAEDQPDPLQLRKVVAEFQRTPKSVVCLQARLNYYNRRENLLTQLFALEYSAWFDYMLPALEELRIPIPLGGTSNHISLQKLREVGEWDPYNVTEDADLGVRLALSGYRTAVIDSLTLEEAPVKMRDWMKQRSRWIKGYMQTWLVHMNEPLKFYRQLGGVAFWGFQFFVGGPCLVFLLAPFMWMLTGLWAAGALIGGFPHWLTWIVLGNLIGGVLLHLATALIVIKKRRWRGMTTSLLVFPYYWVLHSIASLRALWQLVFKPHFWDKTPHGLTKINIKQDVVQGV